MSPSVLCVENTMGLQRERSNREALGCFDLEGDRLVTVEPFTEDCDLIVGELGRIERIRFVSTEPSLTTT